jgi:hypothetical protein
MLGLIRYITSSFSNPHSLSVLYTTLVRPKLEYASVAWNSITSTDSFKLERVQIQFATLYHSKFCAGVCGSNYEGILSRLNISTLNSRRKRLDALFLINVFKNKISCSSIFDTVNLRIPSRRIIDFSTFVVNYNFKVNPSARCVSAAKAICKEIYIFNKDKITLADIS